MATTKTTTSPDREAWSVSDPPRWWPGRAVRARLGSGGGRVPYLVTGVVLVLACTAGVVATVALVGQRIPVLVLARPVVVGHLLTAGDLRTVSLPPDPGLDTVAADQAEALVGRPVAYSLPAGVAVSREMLGPHRTPPAGQGVVAVAAVPGQYPPQLSAGTTVSVIHNPGPGAVVGLPVPVAGGPWTAVVSGIAPPGSDQTTVISLQLPATDARQVAAIPAGQLSIVAEATGTGGR